MNLVACCVIAVNLVLLDACQPDWFNRCHSNGECCSGDCYKPPPWAEGLCRPKTRSCLPEWSNQCRANGDCCTNFCYKPGDWALGLCRGIGTCRPDWDNQCKVSSDCCSNNCYRPGDWKWGVCYPPQEYLNRLPPCSSAPRRKKRAIGYICKEVFRPCKQGYRRIATPDGKKTEYCKRVFSG